MDIQIVNPNLNGTMQNEEVKFIEANTIPMPFKEMKDNHIIPVFVKDNEPTISHTEFVEVMNDCASQFFKTPTRMPAIRVSHPIKGRTPEARLKPAKDLEEWEKTIYYERMAFMVELPQIQNTIDGKSLSLVIGGVRSLNETNLYGCKGSVEKFKIFCGFKVAVCTNLCVWSDGYVGEVKATSIEQLYKYIMAMLSVFDAERQLDYMRRLMTTVLTEMEFATLLGKTKLYNNMTLKQRKGKPILLLNDTQMSSVAKGYLSDNEFGAYEDGSISLWNLYNLMTNAVKNSYIDKFLERNVNSIEFMRAVEQGNNWFGL